LLDPNPEVLTMRRSMRLSMSLAIIAVLIAPGAAAAKPTNDLYRAATDVSPLPFSETRSTTTATIEPGEPAACGQPNNSVWYTYTAPTNQVIRVSTVGSSYDAIAMVYVVTGHGFGGLTPVACARRYNELTAGTTYAIQVIDENPAGGGGTLSLSIEQVMPPSNDAFASAAPVTSLPFTGHVDLTAATLEAGEPDAASCLGFPPLIASAWYAFTPSTEGQLQVFLEAGFENSAAVYTGSSLGTLTRLSCGFQSIAVQPGTTYYIQAAAQSLGKGPADIVMRQTASPEPFISTQPFEPNSIEPTQFFNFASDPGGQDFTETWTFDDGSIFIGSGATHQYATDGDFPVGLSVVTVDGRSGSTQQTISVRTHDVSILGITAPKSAKSGMTRPIAVSVVDRRYPETARLILYRVDASGQTAIGSASLDLVVSSRATTTEFPYTFTADDAAAGKVTFLATIEIFNHEDALPADNTRSEETSVAR
jgi:PKD domain